MYTYNQIKNIHFEISSLCQAKCPMCARNHHGGLPNPLLPEKNIDIEFYKKIMVPDLVKQLESISMCGNFGDPLMNNDLIKMVRYTTEINPLIKFEIHTNGSLRSKKWWREFAEALPVNHILHFGIDGLADTHSIYRIDTDFNKIIDNAKEFISAGGKARWNFITFKHNQHQLESCRNLAKELGFESFHEKQTSRFIGDPWFDVYDKTGTTINRLEGPSEQKIIFLKKEVVENYKDYVKTAEIKCEVVERKSAYVDAQGHLWPCCFAGGVPYLYSAPDQLLYNFKEEYRSTLYKVLEVFGGIAGLDLRNKTIQEIVDSLEWQTVWDDAWEEKEPLVCVRVCGKWDKPVISQCRDQFLDLETFNE